MTNKRNKVVIPNTGVGPNAIPASVEAGIVGFVLNETVTVDDSLQEVLEVAASIVADATPDGFLKDVPIETQVALEEARQAAIEGPNS